VPKKEELKFKSPQQWLYIGKPAPGYDVAEVCSGKPLFGMDVRVDGMLYAAVAHPPVLGGKVKSLDDSATLKVIGVKKTIAIDPFKPPHAFQPLGGVAVIADNTFAAFKGRKQLKVEWDNGANASYNSADYKKELQQTARQPGKVVHTMGDPDAEFAKGGKIVEAEYFAPHLAHASMEPPVAVADVQGEKVTVWSPTQDPQGVQEEVAKALGLKKENVTCHVTFLGGGFGRKSKPDYAVEAAVLSKKTGKPVKVIWSREDDIKFDYYHSVAAMYLKAALDDSGKPKAWLQRSVFPPIGSTFKEGEVYGGAGEMSMGWNVVPFDVPNFRSENGQAAAHVRIGWLRSVANIYHAFAVQSFANELAYAANRDPYDYLLTLIGSARSIDSGQSADMNQKYPYDTARLRHVADVAAEKAGWGKKKFGKGSGMGIAVHRSFFTYVATVVEVEVDDQGAIDSACLHRAGRRNRRQPGDGTVAIRGRRCFRRQHRPHRRDHGYERRHRPVELQRLPVGANERCAAPGRRAHRREHGPARGSGRAGRAAVHSSAVQRSLCGHGKKSARVAPGAEWILLGGRRCNDTEAECFSVSSVSPVVELAFLRVIGVLRG